MKSEPDYPTPQEFIRTSAGLEPDASSNNKTAGATSSQEENNLMNHVSAFSCLPPPEIPQGVDMNMSLLQMMASGTQLPGGGTALAPGNIKKEVN